MAGGNGGCLTPEDADAIARFRCGLQHPFRGCLTVHANTGPGQRSLPTGLPANAQVKVCPECFQHYPRLMLCLPRASPKSATTSRLLRGCPCTPSHPALRAPKVNAVTGLYQTLYGNIIFGGPGQDIDHTAKSNVTAREVR